MVMEGPRPHRPRRSCDDLKIFLDAVAGVAPMPYHEHQQKGDAFGRARTLAEIQSAISADPPKNELHNRWFALGCVVVEQTASGSGGSGRTVVRLAKGKLRA